MTSKASSTESSFSEPFKENTTQGTPSPSHPQEQSNAPESFPNSASETPPPPPSLPPKTATGSLLRAAGLIAFVTIISKVLGAFRDWQILHIYGASLSSDAYFTAFQIPSFALVLLGGLGGPFHTATIAIFSRLIAAKDSDSQIPSDQLNQSVKQLAGTFLTLTSLVFLGLSVLCYQFATPILKIILNDSGNGPLLANAAMQLKIMSPILWLGGIIGIFYGVLNLFNSFFWPSLSPAAQSLMMIVALAIFPHDPTGQLLAWSTLVGAIVQLLLQVPEYLKRGFPLRPSLSALKAPELTQIGEILFPAMLGTTIGQLSVYVDMFFTSMLPEGGWTAIVMSNRLIQLPIGVLQTALLVPIFTRFSRSVSENNPDQVARDFQLGVISLWIISLPILVIMLFYTEPVVRALFEYGQFDAEDTRVVSQALVFLACSMIPYFARDTLTRVFYAFQDAKTPLMVGLFSIGVKAVLDWLFVVKMPYFSVGGITLATTLITFLNMFLLGILSQRHITQLGFGAMGKTFLKLFLAGTAMAAVLELLNRYLPVWNFSVWFPQMKQLPGFSHWGSLLPIGVVSTLGLGVYAGVVACWVKTPETTYLLKRLKITRS